MRTKILDLYIVWLFAALIPELYLLGQLNHSYPPKQPKQNLNTVDDSLNSR